MWIQTLLFLRQCNNWTYQVTIESLIFFERPKKIMACEQNSDDEAIRHLERSIWHASVIVSLNWKGQKSVGESRRGRGRKGGEGWGGEGERGLSVDHVTDAWLTQSDLLPRFDIATDSIDYDYYTLRPLQYNYLKNELKLSIERCSTLRNVGVFILNSCQVAKSNKYALQS